VSAAKGLDRVYQKSEAEKQSLARLYQSERLPDRYEEFSFHALVPVPDEVLKSGFDRVGYDWEVRNWGCKWGALDIKVKPCPMPSKGKVIYKFKTPNSAPVALLDVVAKDHPGVKLILKCKYEEGGTSTTTWEGGSRES